MDRLKLLLAFLVFLLKTNNLLATNNELKTKHYTPLIKEKIFLSINSNVILAGERLYFSIICINNNNTYSDLSKIAYVEIVDSSKQVIKKQKISLRNGKSESFFFIPSNFKTGNYKLIGYTNLMLETNEIELNTIDISIINTYQPIKIEGKNLTTINQDNNSIEVKKSKGYLNEKIFKKREKVKLKINDFINFDPLNTYSLKIGKKDSITEYFKRDTRIKRENIKLNRKITQKPIPELRGEVITGKITSNDKNTSLKNIDLAISIKNKTPFIKIIQTNHLGEFAFSIENLSENSDLIIQVLNEDYEKYNIEIDSQEYLDYSSLNFEKFNLDSSLNKSLEKRSISNQIENAYIDSKKDSIKSIQKFKDFVKLDNIYDLDDYTRFKSLKETLKEIIPHAYYKRIGKKNTIQISDDIPEINLNSPTLVIFDGIYIQDADELFNYNFDNVKSIGVKRNGYLLGSKIYNGILWVESINNDYEPTNNFVIKKEILRPNPELIYYKPDHSSISTTRIPDYRHELVWVPNVKSEDTEIEFYTSDLEGNYELVIEEINVTGKSKFYTESFEVK